MTTDQLRQKGIDTFDEWTAMWNFNLHLAEKIMAPYFTLRYAQADTEPFDNIHRAPELANIIAAWHQKRPGIVFKAEGTAVVDLEVTAGGLAGLIARPYIASVIGENGHTVARSGTDILRLTGGLISEVWSVSSGTAGRTFYR